MTIRDKRPNENITHTSQTKLDSNDLMKQLEELNSPKFVPDQEPVPDHSQVNVKQSAQTTNSPYVDVPSKLMFYPFVIKGDGIALRDVLWRELQLLSAAHETESLRSLMEAMDGTILNMDGLNLTYGDMQFIMYHHRMSLKRPMKLDWTCVSDKHMQMIQSTDEEHQYVDVESLHHTKLVNYTDLTIVHPDTKKLKECVDNEGRLLVNEEPVQNLDGEYLYVGPMLTKTVVEISEEMESIYKDGADNAILARDLSIIRNTNEFAVFISKVPSKTNPTITDRREYFNHWMDRSEQTHQAQIDILAALKQFAEYSNHGVDEAVKCKCEVCGEERVLPIRFNPADFFPEV